MKKEFDMIDLGKLTYFLSMEFAYTNHGIILHQQNKGHFEEIQDAEL